MSRPSRLLSYVRLAMESSCPTFVYSNTDYNNQVSRFRGSDQTQKMSKFDTSLRSAWVERMQRGLFRYHLRDLETRILPGPARLVAQLNIERGQQRRKPQDILSIKQAFDPKLFNFNKANPNETMFELIKQELPGAINENGFTKGCKMVINVSPLEFGHSLIVPEPNQCYPQVLAPYSIQVGIECVLLSSDPGFRVGFNSLGAFASVNHLHLHAYYLNHELAIESAPTEAVMPARGLHCLTTFPRGFLFYTEGGDVHSVVGMVHAVTDFLVNHNIAHNLFLTRGCPPGADCTHDRRRSGVRIIVWPRKSCFGAKEETAFNVALCELAGHLPFKNREDYETASEQNVHSIIIRKAAFAVGLREVAETEEWMVYWTDCSVSMERIMDMKRYQRINHFPGMNEICSKDLLARNLNRMLRLFPKEYNFFPKTWCLPTDYIEFQGYYRMWKQKTFICKPDSGCQGKGIYITRQPQGISPDEHIICQTYISKPFIIEEYKFDLRLYVLVTSCDPLRIILFKEGLMRFATSKYRSPHNNNIGDMCMHLTNYAINKHSENFDHDLQKGSKRKLSWLRSWLEQHSYDSQSVWNNIEDVITKTVIVAAPVLRQNYRTAFPSHMGPSCCFELLGFDILLDYKLKPWLLEVNHSPSFNTDSALDAEVKEPLLKDTLTLLNLGACDRRRIEEEGKRMAQERLLNKRQTSSQRELILSSQASWLAEAQRHEELHSGGFYRLYPRGDEHKYMEFLHQGSSYCQETVTSKAREEYPRRMVQMQQGKDMIAQGRSLGKRWSRSEGRGQQGKSMEEQSRKSNGDHRGDEKNILRQHSAPGPHDWASEGKANQSESSSCGAWGLYETRLIIEEEDLARRRSMAQRKTLVRKVGVVDSIRSFLQPKTHYPVPSKTPHCISHKSKLQLNFANTMLLASSPRRTVSHKSARLQPLLCNTTYSCPAANIEQPISMPKLHQQPMKLAKGPRSGQLSVCVLNLAVPEKLERRRIALPLITGHSTGQWNTSLLFPVPQKSHEDLSQEHTTESHPCLSFSSVNKAVSVEHSKATDSKT